MTCWLGHEWSQWQGEGEWATLYWRPIGAPEKRTCLDCGKVKRRLRPRRDRELGLTENGPPTTPKPSVRSPSIAPYAKPTSRQKVLFRNHCGAVLVRCPVCHLESDEFVYDQDRPTIATHSCQDGTWQFVDDKNPAHDPDLRKDERRQTVSLPEREW